ncbi:MAG TPA: TIGR03790 family protein, partial [Bryobacteraceae bacterium]|nr:TIGR03790 family protein [Bryobacteraceae bacterium]
MISGCYAWVVRLTNPLSLLFPLWLFLLWPGAVCAQTAQNVLVIVNNDSSLSRTIGEYYALRRGIPKRNICGIRAGKDQDISRAVYDSKIAAPIARCLQKNGLVQKILYIVTTAGVPLRIPGTDGAGGTW